MTKLPKNYRKTAVIGFLDETSPQLNSNTQRLWSFNKPKIKKNTEKLRANTFGFYTTNGKSTISFKPRSRKEEVIEFLKQIRKHNPDKPIILILDNFPSHKAKLTIKTAQKLNIKLIYLPPYSPQLNPIEYIWKTIKHKISPKHIENLQQFKQTIKKLFEKYSKRKTFAQSWIKKFWTQIIKE